MGQEESETVGQLLRAARNRRGLTVPQIAATTKIPVRHLEALERDDFAAVPGGLYLRGEILAYADVVGVDRGVALDRLHAAIDPPVIADAHEPADPPPLWWHRARSLGTAAAVCLALAAVTIWWASGRVTAPVPAVVPALGADAAGSDLPSATSGTIDVAAAPTDFAGVDQPVRATELALEVVSEPSGARVTIDGVGRGFTPLTIKYLEPGVRQVRLTLDGFLAEERLVRLSTKRPQTSVNIELHEID